MIICWPFAAFYFSSINDFLALYEAAGINNPSSMEAGV